MGFKIDKEKNEIVIEFDLNSTEMSKSGKTYILASSHGFKWEEGIGVSYNIIKRK